jgi:hypothetical protein
VAAEALNLSLSKGFQVFFSLFQRFRRQYRQSDKSNYGEEIARAFDKCASVGGHRYELYREFRVNQV